MQQPIPLPLALRIVTLVALLSGLSSLFQVISAALSGNVFLDFGVLGIFAYFGLRRLSNAWRIYLLFCCWVGLIASPIMIISALNGATFKFSIFGLSLNGIPPLPAILLCLAFFIYLAWQLHVLTRPEIVRLFAEKGLSGA